MDQKLFESALAEFDYLNKVMIESCAQVAFNSVIFENALSEEVLTEAEGEEDNGENKKKIDFTKAKNAAMKALEAVKMFAQTIWAKIKSAVNETIAKVSNGAAFKLIDSYSKKVENPGAMIKVDKDLELGNPTVVFSVNTALGNVAFDSEENIAKTKANELSAKLPNNYADAKAKLGEAKTLSDVSKVYSSLTSFAAANDKAETIESFLKKVPNSKAIIADIKKAYADGVKDSKDQIKKFSNGVNAATTADEAMQQKNAMTAYTKLLGTVHSSFIGYLKWVIAYSAQAAKAINSAKKGGVKVEAKNESAMTFMGLNLL